MNKYNAAIGVKLKRLSGCAEINTLLGLPINYLIIIAPVPPQEISRGTIPQHSSSFIYIYIQGVPGGMCQTSGECSLSSNTPI